MRIANSISGMERQLLNLLSQASQGSLDSAVRLSTGQRFNRPADGVSGFYEVSRLEDRLNIVESTKKKVTLASNTAAQAQVSLDQVRTQLEVIRTTLLTDTDQELTAAEREASQETIDEAIEAIESISGIKINGRQLLNGDSDFKFSGLDRSQVRRLDVHAARNKTIDATVSTAATQATVTISGVTAATAIDAADEQATVVVDGPRGTGSFEIAASSTYGDWADQVNGISHLTGVVAEFSGGDLLVHSVDYGDKATVDITTTRLDESVDTQTGTGSDAVVSINGLAVSSSQVDGNRVSHNQNGTRFRLEFEEGFQGTISTITIDDSQVQRFQLSTDLHQYSEFTLGSVHSSALGGLSGTLANIKSGGGVSGLDTNTSHALRIVDEALGRLTVLEARADAFADVTVDAAEKLLDGFKTTLDDTIEDVNSIDESEESLVLAKNQSLAANTLSAISILQQQQFGALALLRQISGV